MPTEWIRQLKRRSLTTKRQQGCIYMRNRHALTSSDSLLVAQSGIITRNGPRRLGSRSRRDEVGMKIKLCFIPQQHEMSCYLYRGSIVRSRLPETGWKRSDVAIMQVWFE